ncbi:hypothetical protein [Glycomyces harbinensis]|uniref:NurA domain-containing protein n=1 Tax=Glycomyces harbinensis TaxID=58114 RepID=A0A1G6SZY6_9ACTN|nr:hypothetical protein [Glycomyces harbinensis]SDD22329.1 hypothetical protein SAMN05216270_102398 [Glycomyces harbinensis]
MQITVDAWDPSFADNPESPSSKNQAIVEPSVELDPADWRPIDAPANGPRRIVVVDGVRRVDARVELIDDGERWPGVCVSWAAGAVACDLDGRNSAVTEAAVERGLFAAVDPGADFGRYPHREVESADPAELIGAAQAAMAELEAKVASMVAMDAELSVLDGPLRGRTRLPNSVGYIKSHQRAYLPKQLNVVVERLKPGQRTPVFHLTSGWPRYTWYLRLPGTSSRGWAGVARIEAATDLSEEAAIALADATAASLPPLGSAAHKDARAPQNLTPIAGLERRLKRMLGDPRLLLRSVRAASLETGGPS